MVLILAPEVQSIAIHGRDIVSDVRLVSPAPSIACDPGLRRLT